MPFNFPDAPGRNHKRELSPPTSTSEQRTSSQSRGYPLYRHISPAQRSRLSCFEVPSSSILCLNKVCGYRHLLPVSLSASVELCPGKKKKKPKTKQASGLLPAPLPPTFVNRSFPPLLPQCPGRVPSACLLTFFDVELDPHSALLLQYVLLPF